MAPQKRKYHDAGLEPPLPHGTTRRSTRQHPDTSTGAESADYQLRSGRVRANTIENLHDAEISRPTSRGRESDALNAAVAELGLATNTKQTRTTRHKVTIEPQEADEVEAPIAHVQRASTSPDNTKKHVAQSKQPHRPHQHSCSPPPPKLQSSSPSQQHRPAQKPSSRSTRPLPAAAGSSRASLSRTTITPNHNPTNKPKTPKFPGTPRSDRNIDKVVFGNTCFKAWYPSYYGKEVIGDVAANAGAANPKIGGGKRAPPMLDRLYICPCCFKYSKEIMPWCQHVRYCESKRHVPGTKVYTHPRRSATVSVPRPSSTSTTTAGMAKGQYKRVNDSSQTTDEAALNSGEWSVWEVDGDSEGLFCQNLSLFAKLFLDNKSVFFDVTGFNYFLLVYTPPPCEIQTSALTQANSASKSESSTLVQPNPQSCPSTSRPQIVGFFSKEKMSWDNNNLACILVFPPWQQKGLGALLMGVSYEISRREGILGGPEKPISELGRKGYKRFWAGEVVRWILELDLPKASSDSAHTARPTTREMEKEKEKGKGKEKGKEKEKAGEEECIVVDVEQCSRDTWIVAEDCLAVLREMGVVEEAGLGPPKYARHGETDGIADANTQGKEKEDKEVRIPLVHRVRIDKAAVRAWARANNIGLAKACDPRGFVEGYAIKKVDDNDSEG
ncbi:acyl-CoA N-acyltransferase [Xylaria nigripes]|nr:acyl-CoA N-acyltransferase [Xylaria nigripes]